MPDRFANASSRAPPFGAPSLARLWAAGFGRHGRWALPRWRQLRASADRREPPAEPASLDPPISRIDGDDLTWAFPRLGALAGELVLRLIVERYPASRASVGGYFHPSSSTLSLNNDNAVNHQVKTFVHELSHALLRRDLELTDLSLTCAEEELVCESVAYTVCGSIGLDTSGRPTRHGP